MHWEILLENIVRDIGLAIRSLGRDRRSSLLAIAALALGIGASTVIFSLFYGVLLHPFPYKDSDRLVTFALENLTNHGASTGRNWFSWQEFLTFREQNHIFEDLVAYHGGLVSMVLRDGNGPRLYPAAHVTASTFDFYAVPPLLGRAITPQDGTPEAPPVFVMNFRMWQTEFGGDPGVLGKTFVLDGRPRTLVGIMPRPFNIYRASVWMPMVQASEFGAGTLVGRIKPGISLPAAAADLDLIAHHLTEDEHGSVLNPDRYAVVVHTLVEETLGNFKLVLYALLAAVFLLLLIACTNVANLLLARATAREREIAVRAALGASRLRLVRQLLAESLVLSAGACITGWVLAGFALQGLLAAIPPGAIPGEAAIGLNRPVLWFALGTTALTTFLCGIAPALHAIGRDLQSGLTGSAQGMSGGIRRGRLRGALLVTEVALSITLLAGAGLMMRNFFGLLDTHLPFDAAKMLYVTLDLPHDRYDGKPDRKPAFFKTVLPRIQALPGVVSATESWMLPPDEGMWSDVTIPGKPHVDRWTTDFQLCTEGYFRTLGLQLLRGRLLSQDDVDSAQHVAVVNQTLARQYFPNQDPLGQRIKFEVFDRPFLDAPRNAYFEIVGIVKDFKTRPTGAEYLLRPEAFLPLSVVNLSHFPSILAQTAVEPHSLLKDVQREIWAVDPEIAVRASGSIEDLLQSNFQQPRFEWIVLASFAGVGLLLAVLGVFSVMAYAVSLQTHDIGIRLALGAEPRDILRMVLNQGLALIVAGIGIGVAVSLGLTRFLASQLWGVSASDPWTFAAVVVAILSAGLAACFFPARRAMQVDPVTALRYE
jgi:putative ABC transport system permease protein